jgi:mono/diheme cytochrome c family protein
MTFRRVMLLAFLACSAGTAACTSDEEPANPAPTDASASKDASGDHSDAAADQGDANQADLVARGFYLVNYVAACVDCHTPRDEKGALDTTKHLAGSPVPFADVVPDDAGDDGGRGAIYARNITPDMDTGIGKWTDEQIKKAILDGVDDEGKPIFPIMPYYVFHTMTDDDANAIVAYLRSITPIKNAIPERQDVPGFTAAAMPVPVSAIPSSSIAMGQPHYEEAQHGRYLAGLVGACMECHTQHRLAAVPLDTAKLFAGNEVFSLPAPFGDVHSSNITPDPNGIKGWTPENVRDLLKLGTDKDGKRICPPMPAGPMQAFGGLTDDDALAIGYYLTTIPAIDNGTIPHCTPPVPPPVDGGDAGDAARPDSNADAPSNDAPSADAGGG